MLFYFIEPQTIFRIFKINAVAAELGTFFGKWPHFCSHSLFCNSVHTYTIFRRSKPPPPSGQNPGLRRGVVCNVVDFREAVTKESCKQRILKQFIHKHHSLPTNNQEINLIFSLTSKYKSLSHH